MYEGFSDTLEEQHVKNQNWILSCHEASPGDTESKCYDILSPAGNRIGRRPGRARNLHLMGKIRISKLCRGQR